MATLDSSSCRDRSEWPIEVERSSYATKLWDQARRDGYGYRRSYDKETVFNCRVSSHTHAAVARFRKTRVGTVEPVSHFYRLHPDGVARTLLAGTGREYGSFTSPRPIHPKQARCITVREGARLHSFPDWFRFNETVWHGFRQIGNSVPPALARAVASNLVRVLGYEPSKPSGLVRLGDDGLLELSRRGALAYFGIDPLTLPAQGAVVGCVPKH